MEYPVLDTKATGARIRELRKARHLKVEDVARFMGFESEQAVYKWQRETVFRQSTTCMH